MYVTSGDMFHRIKSITPIPPSFETISIFLHSIVWLGIQYCCGKFGTQFFQTGITNIIYSFHLPIVNKPEKCIKNRKLDTRVKKWSNCLLWIQITRDLSWSIKSRPRRKETTYALHSNTPKWALPFNWFVLKPCTPSGISAIPCIGPRFPFNCRYTILQLKWTRYFKKSSENKY